MKFIFRMIIFFMCLLFLPDPLFADPNSLDGGQPPVPVLKNSGEDLSAGGYNAAKRSSIEDKRVHKRKEFISTTKPLPSIALPTDWNGFHATPPRVNVKKQAPNSTRNSTLTKAEKIGGGRPADKKSAKGEPQGFSSLGRPANVPRPVADDAKSNSDEPDVSGVDIPMPVPKWRLGGDKTDASDNSLVRNEEASDNEQPLVKQVALPIPPPVTVWPQKDIVLAQNKCHLIMDKVDATVKPIKPIRNGACGAAAPLMVSAVGAAGLQKVSISPAATLNCKFTARFAKWVKNDLQPLAVKYFNSPVSMVHNVASYSCRHRYNDKSRKISEHALANALDIAGFTLKNGTSISVLKHWPEDSEMSEFLKAVHKSACKNFIVVLGPEANEAHRNHFHFDVGRYKVCN